MRTINTISFTLFSLVLIAACGDDSGSTMDSTSMQSTHSDLTTTTTMETSGTSGEVIPTTSSSMEPTTSGDPKMSSTTSEPQGTTTETTEPQGPSDGTTDEEHGTTDSLDSTSTGSDSSSSSTGSPQPLCPELTGCNGECVPQNYWGDSICDAELDCEQFFFDLSDCTCQIMDCDSFGIFQNEMGIDCNDGLSQGELALFQMAEFVAQYPWLDDCYPDPTNLMELAETLGFLNIYDPSVFNAEKPATDCFWEHIQVRMFQLLDQPIQLWTKPDQMCGVVGKGVGPLVVAEYNFCGATEGKPLDKVLITNHNGIWQAPTEAVQDLRVTCSSGAMNKFVSSDFVMLDAMGTAIIDQLQCFTSGKGTIRVEVNTSPVAPSGEKFQLSLWSAGDDTLHFGQLPSPFCIIE